MNQGIIQVIHWYVDRAIEDFEGSLIKVGVSFYRTVRKRARDQCTYPTALFDNEEIVVLPLRLTNPHVAGAAEGIGIEYARLLNKSVNKKMESTTSCTTNYTPDDSAVVYITKVKAHSFTEYNDTYKPARVSLYTEYNDTYEPEQEQQDLHFGSQQRYSSQTSVTTLTTASSSSSSSSSSPTTTSTTTPSSSSSGSNYKKRKSHVDDGHDCDSDSDSDSDCDSDCDKHRASHFANMILAKQAQQVTFLKAAQSRLPQKTHHSILTKQAQVAFLEAAQSAAQSQRRQTAQLPSLRTTQRTTQLPRQFRSLPSDQKLFIQMKNKIVSTWSD